MRNNKLKHTKVRNTGLLFEFLLRQITADVLNGGGDSKAARIVKQRFNENTELGKELAFYNILINKKFNNDKKADYFITEVISERKGLNSSVLKREKYNLIKEIGGKYDLQKFLSSKVNNYKVYASIYKLFEYNNISPVEKTESHFNLVEHVTTSNKTNIKSSLSVVLPKDEDLRILTYKTLLEKFNAKYSKLNYPQKSLLRAYINNVSNTNSLKEYIETVVPVIKKELKQHSNKLQDKVVLIKLTEAIKSIDKLCGVKRSKLVKDNVVVQTMRYMELLKELKKSGNKNKKVI
jgi:hypothetical protein|tara:strand:+ start:2204 stop:3082 length:879 start_codon:yes stop_codon:yes gene_type:complete